MSYYTSNDFPDKLDSRNILLHALYHITFATQVPSHQVLQDVLDCIDMPQCQEEVHLLTIPPMDEETILYTIEKLQNTFPQNCNCKIDQATEDCLYISAYECAPWCTYHSTQNVICVGERCSSRFMTYLDDVHITEYFEELKVSTVDFKPVPDPYGFTPHYESEEEEDDTAFSSDWFEQQRDLFLSHDSVTRPSFESEFLTDTRDSGYASSICTVPDQEDNLTCHDCRDASESGPHVPEEDPSTLGDICKSFADVARTAVSTKGTLDYRSVHVGPRVTELAFPPRVNQPRLPQRARRRLHPSTKLMVASVCTEEVSKVKVPDYASTTVMRSVFDTG